MAIAHNPLTGRGLAIAGVILGVISLFVWSGFIGLLGYGYVQTRPDQAIVRSFLQDLSDGNRAAAQALCAPGTPPSLVQQSIAEVQPYGTLSTFSSNNFNYNSLNGSTTATLGGVAVFANASKTVTVTLIHPAAGAALIQTWQIK